MRGDSLYSTKMADKVGECPVSWPVLLGASFVSGLLVGYWLKGRVRYAGSEGEGDSESDVSCSFVLYLSRRIRMN